MENVLYRNWDLQTARSCDYWLASSQYIASLYSKFGVAKERIFCSYYGCYLRCKTWRCIDELRSKLSLPKDHYIVGNINYMYAPKYYLGHRVGIKRHELILDKTDDTFRVQLHLVLNSKPT